MIDLDEGRLKAWLDGEVPPDEARELEARVERDPEVRRKVERLRGLQDRTAYLLGQLDKVEPPTERVRAAVRRSAGRRPRAGSWIRRSRPAQAAAAVLLFVGVAAAAIPGSPVRAWIERSLGPEPEAAPEQAVEPASDRPDSTGITVSPDEGRIRVELVGLPPGAEVLVALTDRGQASVYAPAASGLEGEDGRIRVRASAGPIRVDLPRILASADLVVDGRVYFTRRGDDWGLRVPAADSSATSVLLRTGR